MRLMAQRHLRISFRAARGFECRTGYAGAMRRGARRAQQRRRLVATGAGLAGAAALSGGALGLLVRRRRSARREAGPVQELRCECGQAFRVAGLGRHRVYWLPEAPESEPLMSDGCPECGRALPVEPAAAAA